MVDELGESLLFEVLAVERHLVACDNTHHRKGNDLKNAMNSHFVGINGDALDYLLRL